MTITTRTRIPPTTAPMIAPMGTDERLLALAPVACALLEPEPDPLELEAPLESPGLESSDEISPPCDGDGMWGAV
jgi:hypothetical protein